MKKTTISLFLFAALITTAYAKGGVCTIAKPSTDPKKIRWSCEHIEDGTVTIKEIFEKKFTIRAIGPQGDFLIIEK